MAETADQRTSHPDDYSPEYDVNRYDDEPESAVDIVDSLVNGWRLRAANWKKEVIALSNGLRGPTADPDSRTNLSKYLKLSYEFCHLRDDGDEIWDQWLALGYRDKEDSGLDNDGYDALDSMRDDDLDARTKQWSSIDQIYIPIIQDLRVIVYLIVWAIWKKETASARSTRLGSRTP